MDASALDPAQTAFQEGLRIFKDTLTRDPEKKRLADQLLGSCTLDDLRKTIFDAKLLYEQRRGRSRMSEYLVKFSQRLMYYGNIVDVLAQQHPEYVCLVWASMKLVFSVSKFPARGATLESLMAKWLN